MARALASLKLLFYVIWMKLTFGEILLLLQLNSKPHNMELKYK
jgi:hypothetical protein